MPARKFPGDFPSIHLDLFMQNKVDFEFQMSIFVVMTVQFYEILSACNYQNFWGRITGEICRINEKRIPVGFLPWCNNFLLVKYPSLEIWKILAKGQIISKANCVFLTSPEK